MTLYFPQLATGTAGQFPLTKIHMRRTVVNRLADGSEIRLADPDAALAAWDIEYHGLGEAERIALNDFFVATQGRLRSFVFLDPCGNLLAHSEDLSKPVWEVDSLIRVEEGDNCTRLINTAQSVMSVSQAITAPARYRFCGSAELRSETAETVQLWMGAEGQRFSSETITSGEWLPAACSGQLDSDNESITFGIALAAGAVVEVRGLQLEAQPGRGGYRRTAVNTGRYGETRFDQDELVFRADGIDNHSTFLRLVSRVRL